MLPGGFIRSVDVNRAAGDRAQVRALHLQYITATGGIVAAETAWATGACGESEQLKAFIRRLWDDAASAGLHPDKSWITETVLSDCPFTGETLR